MPETADTVDECGRIGLLIGRGGPDTTRRWVQRTLAIYRQALTDDRIMPVSPGIARVSSAPSMPSKYG